ncbi:MAG: phospholipase [Chloroflexota bacterium]|nr:phospholipase [Chloroflexota bacterium]
MPDLFHIVAEPRRPVSQPYSCLVLLHGRGSNEEDLFGLVPELPPELFVVSFRAPYRMPWGGFMWYDMVENGRPEESTFQEALGSLLAALRALPGQYAIDPERLFLGGFSQGAMMSACVTLVQPSLARAAIMLSGYLPAAGLEIDASGSKGKSLFMGHGTLDSLLPVSLAQRARAELEELGLKVEYHEYPMDHQVVPQELADLRAWLDRQLA